LANLAIILGIVSQIKKSGKAQQIQKHL